MTQRSNGENSNRPYKVLVVGDINAGKTSLIGRYVKGTFNYRTLTTLGVEFSSQVVSIDSRDVEVQLWDIAGQERYRQMTRVYFFGAKGAMVVCDPTGDLDSTLEAATEWKESLDTKVGARVPCLLVVTKCDLVGDVASKHGPTFDAFCRENGFIGWIHTSSKENINVTEAFQRLSEHVVRHHGAAGGADDPNTVRLNSQRGRGSGCYGCFYRAPVDDTSYLQSE